VAPLSPLVSIVIPCRNEKDHISACIQSLLTQEPPEGGFEVIVADGMSTDGTRDVLQALVRVSDRVRMLDNPQRVVSTGLNAAIGAARGEIIIRADAHTRYATDYVRQCVEVLRESRADNVGGPWRAVSTKYIGRAIAAAFHSRFGSGGARAHDPNYEGLVDTVYLGCWHRDLFDRIGGFDEELVRNQDDEFNLRLIRAGGRVWQSPRIQSLYEPRNSFRELFRQYMQYGYWKVRVIQKHRMPASWRHLVPVVMVLTFLVLAPLSIASALAARALAIASALYLVSDLGASLITAVHTEMKLLPILPVVFFCYHAGYGFGFLRGICDFLIFRRGAPTEMTRISRGQP
jgi:succinoglycan biosynthesis protein ExoA